MTTFNQSGQTVQGEQYNAGGDMNIEQGDTTINSGDTYSGNFSGAILNVRSTLTNVTQSIGTLPYASAEDKQTLEDLIQQLTAALEEATTKQPALADDSEAVAETAKDLVEKANKEKPNRKLLEINGKNLVDAAENLAKIVPAVLGISKQIVAFILGIVPV